ncbi:MAG: TonB-dependent receptor [Acidobacteriota bacterium]
MYTLVRMVVRGLVLAMVLLVLGSYCPSWGQSNGATSASLTGIITDESSAVLGNAVVKAKNLNNNFVREAVSDESGAFLLNQLTPGPYEVIVSAEGFKTKTLRVELELGTTKRFSFTMQVGGNTEVVEVTASGFDEGRTENSTNITRERIDGLPINRRNFLDFALTSARVTPDRLPPQGVAQTSGLSFNGQSARYNNITIDGLDNNDMVTNAVRQTFSQDAVQEFQVVSDNYSAEFGRALAGVINIVTKSGSNEYHGDLFFLTRNDELSARNAFATFDPQFEQYQFGSVLGGPIKKDRLFFFTSFERLSINRNNVVTISDATVRSANRVGFTALRNGPIPLSQGTVSVFGRVDARINPNDTLWVRYNYGGSYDGAFETFGALIGEDAGGVQRLDDNTIAANNTYVNTGLGLVNETRFQYSRRKQFGIASGEGPRVSLVAPEGGVIFGRAVLLSQLRLENIYQIIDNVTLTRGRNQLKFGVDFSYIDFPDDNNLPVFVRGQAVFAPIDFRPITGDPNAPVLSGLQAFDPSLRTAQQRDFLNMFGQSLPINGQPLANLPIPVNFMQGFGVTNLAFNIKFLSAFVQDDIKLKPNLLLKLGTRYDLVRVKFQPKNDGNLSPRVAFSYRPKENINVRGAYGLFFGGPVLGAVQITQTFLSNSYNIAVLPFPLSILAFNQPGRRFPETTSIPSSIRFVPQLSQTFQNQPDFRNSYTQQATLGIDYFINNDTAVSITYDYVRGLKLFAQRNINPIVRPIRGNPGLSALTGRVDPTRGNVFENESIFDSYYHALTLSFNRRFTKRVGLLAHYTFSKSIDNVTDFRATVQEFNDPLNLLGERGLSIQDVRNRFTLSGTWELSYTQNPLLRDFQLSTIVSLESGRPYNLLAGVDLNLNGDNGQGDRPLSIARNAGITPGFANVDLRLTRTVNVNERVRIQGIFEVFNLFNRVNISDVARVFPPDPLGRFSLPPQEDGRFISPQSRHRGSFSPRQFQIGFRLIF